MAHNLNESLRDPANGPLVANEYERTQTAIGCRSHEAIRTRLCVALVARFEAIQIACTGEKDMCLFALEKVGSCHSARRYSNVRPSKTV